MALQVRACQIDACSERVPQTLTQQGVCLGHYLDEAFTRVSGALELCRRGQPLDSAVLDWLLEQGDFAVRLLSRDDLMQSSEQRSRLLELLLCLANVQEYVRRHAVSKTS
jgi:hypothetical protein